MLDREFFDDEYWNQKRSFSFSEARLDLIQMSRFEEKPTSKILTNGREIAINQGEVHASLRFLSKRWNWGLDKTKRFIDKLNNKNQINRRTEQGESIIKVLILSNLNKSSKHQPVHPSIHSSVHQSLHSSLHHPNSSQTPTDTNNNKENKVKKEEESKEREYRSFAHLSLSIMDWHKLKQEGYTNTQIDNVLDAIENHRGNTKYKSLYLTARNWLKRDFNTPAKTKSKYAVL